MEREKNRCRAWYEGDPILEEYHDNEWCKVNHDDNFQFEMTDEELENLMLDSGIIRNRSKIFSVRKNAQAVKKIQAQYGSFDAYLWHFTENNVIDGHWKTVEQIPTVSDVSRKMALDMKKKGIAFVGPVITYSFLQSIGMVNDHLKDCKYRDH